jgi:hypothetical protein
MASGTSDGISTMMASKILQPERPDDAGAVAADCYRLAGQIGGGAVRDALLEMGRDYTSRARDTARTAKFRVEQAQRQPDAAGFWPLRILADLFAPLPVEPARRITPVARRVSPSAVPAIRPPAQRATTPAAPPVRTKAAPRSSRLFRLHALGVVQS